MAVISELPPAYVVIDPETKALKKGDIFLASTSRSDNFYLWVALRISIVSTTELSVAGVGVILPVPFMIVGAGMTSKDIYLKMKVCRLG